MSHPGEGKPGVEIGPQCTQACAMVWEYLGPHPTPAPALPWGCSRLWEGSLGPGLARQWANARSVRRFAPTFAGHSGPSWHTAGAAQPGQLDKQHPGGDGWGTWGQLPGVAAAPPGTVTFPAMGMGTQAPSPQGDGTFKGCRLLGHRPTSPAACSAPSAQGPAPGQLLQLWCGTDLPQPAGTPCPAEPAPRPGGPCPGLSGGVAWHFCTATPRH